MRDPITTLPTDKDMLQKKRIALFVDSTMKSSCNANNTLMDVRVMNMQCSSLHEMIEVTCKIFAPAAAETIPFPSILIHNNVFDHIGLLCTLKNFEPDHTRFTEGFVKDEVTAYVETIANIARTVRNKKMTSESISVSPPGYMYMPRTM